MSAEKKKRTPKPPITNYVRIILDGLDFFNFNRGKALEPERDLFKTMIPLLRAMLPADMQVMDKGLLQWMLPWANDPETMEYLWLTQRNCNLFLTWFAEPDPLRTGLGSWAQDAMKGLSLVAKDADTFHPVPFVELDVIPDIAPSGDKGETFRRTWHKGFRARLVKLIFDAFSEVGHGAFYIGACPKCKEIFSKKRGDQEYCSKDCGSAAGMARMRAK